MVGCLTLTQVILVQIQVPEQPRPVPRVNKERVMKEMRLKVILPGSSVSSFR